MAIDEHDREEHPLAALQFFTGLLRERFFTLYMNPELEESTYSVEILREIESNSQSSSILFILKADKQV